MMFDFANSSYTTVIITALFNAYFVRAVVNQANSGELLWSVTLSISYMLVIFLGPVFGAMADYSGLKKRFLFLSSSICVISTAMLFFVKPGYVFLAVVLVVLSNLGYSASENFVSSFLPNIAQEGEMGKISGYAWSFGYIGGLLSLFICLLILRFYKPGGSPNSYLSVRMSSLVTALFFGIAAIPTFLWVRERRNLRSSPPGGYFRTAFRRLGSTFKRIREFRELIKFLISYLFFNSGISVVIAFAAVYAQKDLGFTPDMTVLLIIVVNITASVGAFIFGFIEDRVGAKRTILATLLIWIATVGTAYFVQNRKLFWFVANLAGIAMGSSQSSARALIGLFSPDSKSAEFFGFWGLAGKASAIVGILSFGLMSYLLQSNRLAILSTLFYFLLGMIALFSVDEERGRSVARSFQEDEGVCD